MPIYEYICERCGRLSSFFVRNIGAHRSPSCPHCGARGMRRAVSRFAPIGRRERAEAASADRVPASNAVPEGGEDLGGDEPMGGQPDLSEMESLLESVDENDPRSMGRIMRRLAEQSGEPVDEEMEEAMRRLEDGEDPEKIDEKMGGAAEGGGEDEWYDG